MRLELHRRPPPGDDEPSAEGSTPEPAEVLATVTWEAEGAPAVEAGDPEVAAAVRRAFRPVAVVTEDPAHRRLGTSGPSTIEPGSFEWFLAVAQTRLASETGLAVRMVPGVQGGGFDPAAGYRTFDETVERLASGS